MELGKALFFDIETHRGKEWEELTPQMQRAFINHYYDDSTYPTPAEHYSEIAGLHAEFSQVICISFGYVAVGGNFIKTSIYGPDERIILENAKKLFDNFLREGYSLWGHNIISCDTSYLVKRYIINKMMVPVMINNFGKKPWEVDMVDTMDLWKFGDYKRVSLEMICASMGIPCKTDELGGSNLYTYKLSEMPWDMLVHYCEEDVESNYKFAKQTYDYLPE